MKFKIFQDLDKQINKRSEFKFYMTYIEPDDSSDWSDDDRLWYSVINDSDLFICKDERTNLIYTTP